MVRAKDSFSAQEYTPFEGMELSGKVRQTYVRGRQILRDGNVVGTPTGRYVSRPTRPAGAPGGEREGV